jgi:tetratricopeptide (TPR) repeat protein
VLTLQGFGFSYPEQIEWGQRAARWCEQHPQIAEVYLARVKYTYAYAMAIQDGRLGVAWAQQAVDLYRRLDLPDRRPLLSALSRLCSASIQHLQAVDQAAAALDEAERLYQSLGPEFIPEGGRLRWEMVVHVDRARIANERGDHQQAKPHCAEALRLATLGGESEVFIIEVTWAHACFSLKDCDEAELHVRAALAATDENDPVFQRTSWANWWLGYINLARGDLDQALTYCRVSLRAASELTEYGIVAAGLEVAAIIAARRSETLRAARLSGATVVLREKHGQRYSEQASLGAILPGWRDGPAAADIQQAYDLGRAMDADEAVAYALDEAAG